ncbi:dipeptide/oligopeptide/nickel ABC transporter permease/ATP-binding protein [Streptosporangium sp. NPDC051022]|uniref:dipeptide/oligopeptide/nickel ABC transporter permease/ATP-binding protein n=1 Tax=Streptosporangium sp. NPDC051022 TaxID=3155752 RepID=UPI00343B11A1
MTIPEERPGFWRRLIRNRPAFAAVLFLAFTVAVALLAPWITPQDPAAQDLASSLQGPSGAHWLGTDQVGRDNLARLIAGTRLSVLAMLQCIAIALAIGIPLGMSAGYAGGRWERVVMWLSDLVFALPAILLVFGIVAVMGVSLGHAMTALGLVFSTRYIALGRTLVKAARQESYVDSARVVGLGGPAIVTRHITPNILRPLIVQTSVLLSAIILVEAELSFLGLAAEPGQPSWGRMLHDAQNFFVRQPFLPVPPGLAVTLLVIALNLAGDGIADALAKQVHGAVPPAGRAARAARARVRERVPAPAGQAGQAVQADPDALLRVEGLEVSFPTEDGGHLVVVDGVSLSVRPGETLGLAGESGCGKSMTASAILGLVPAPGRITAGRVWLGEHELTALPERELRRIRGREIGMVFQEPASALDPAMTIGRQIAEPLRVHEGLSRKAAQERAAELLAMVGVPDPRARLRDYPHQFSGGMAQRVVIARALACGPKVLLADEPTTALDVTVQGQVLDLLADLHDRLGTAVVFVTHDLGVVADICDRVAVMYAGQVVESGTCEEVFARPSHPYTAALIAAAPGGQSSGRNRADRLATIPGRVPPTWEWTPTCRFRDRCAFAVDACAEQPSALTGGAHAVRCLRAAELALEGSP